MISLKWEKLIVGVAALLVITVPSGCHVFYIQPNDAWPAEMAYLAEHAAELASDLEAYLTEPAAIETTIDDLAELDGCWGAVVTVPTAIDGLDDAVYQFLKYDANEGVLARYVIDNGLFCELKIQTGTLSLTHNGRIIYELNKEQFQTCDSNQPFMDITEDERPVYELLAAFNDDGELRAAFVTLSGYSPAPAGFADLRELVHVKVDCPE